MVKDYFQDIIPPEEPHARPMPEKPLARKIEVSEHEKEEEDLPAQASEPQLEKSIRNIEAPQRPTRPVRAAVAEAREPSDFALREDAPKTSSRTGRTILWGVALLALLLIAFLGLFAFRKTTVTVIPRSHTIVFDESSRFIAVPASAAANASSTLTYTLATQEFSGSEVLPASGTAHVENKAQGTVTIYNDYSENPLKLIKDTRFTTQSGLVFRIQDQVVVPGKIGTTPGSVMAAVYADQPGDQYNIGPVSRFTVPGLQSNPAMYSNIYARSIASTTGGFSGDQPTADPTAVQNTISDIRTRLGQKIRESIAALSGTSTMILPDLIQIAYQDMPQTPGTSGQVHINEVAHASYPVFDAAALAQAIALTTSADLQGASLTLIPGTDFSAHAVNASSTALGNAPIMFSLSGNATLLWQVDGNALANALAGRDEAAFPTIANGFPGVQEAHARIEPFWKKSFPDNPADIRVVIEPPKIPQ